MSTRRYFIDVFKLKVGIRMTLRLNSRVEEDTYNSMANMAVIICIPSLSVKSSKEGKKRVVDGNEEYTHIAY